MTTTDSEDTDNENTADKGRRELGHRDPGHLDLGHGVLGHGEPGRRDPGHGELGHGELGHGDMRHGELGHGDVGNGDVGAGDLGAGHGHVGAGRKDMGPGVGVGVGIMGEAEGVGGGRFTSTHLRVLVAASGWSALAATAVPGPAPLRWIPVLLFVLFGPGCAALYPQPGRLASGARLEAVALAAPISLSLGVLAATSLFLVKAFSMTAFLVSLACFTTVTAALPGLPLPAARRGAVERAKVRRRPSGGSDT
ncbi:DUF1616 domain-containing protein [Streptomyces sp. 303MFCol5.2]|uniref:DUF1616 domain-containing protein n=1 Tax=Streptomyces sp. 303MFCol5.2 TaxID=1172181 RepID=UPI0003A12985|nr:DUF1616 domain-containing protein [Streptomyces sp. 303MFCol5.2]